MQSKRQPERQYFVDATLWIELELGSEQMRLLATVYSEVHLGRSWADRWD
jgi:hypothetical protein